MYHNRFTLLKTFAAVILIIAGSCDKQKDETLNYLFESGKDGYHTFRIPAIVTTTHGWILAFAEGRKKSRSDTGDIDLVMKVSKDNGKTWSNLKVIWDDGENVCGNPAPVVNRSTGIIYLLSTWNLGSDHEKNIISQTSKDTRHVYIMKSEDDGITWSKPEEITKSVKQDNWTWYATGPGHGIQLQKGNNKGRLIIACDHIESGTNKYYSHIIYSDDNGSSWKMGGTTPQDQVNECTVAELSDGRLMLNMRNYDRTKKTRKVSLSSDGGLTLGDIYPDTVLTEPICHASLLSVTDKSSKRNSLIFLNPSDTEKREKMTIRLSFDDGVSWAVSKVLYQGPSAYSDLTQQPDGRIGCLYEAGKNTPYQGIVYEIVSLNDVKKNKRKSGFIF